MRTLEEKRFEALCERIASVLERHGLSAKDLMDSLPAARARVFARRYPSLARKSRSGNRRGKWR
jgi:hypothetical protein